MGVEVLLQARVAEQVPAMCWAARLPQEMRADRAEQIVIGLRLKHQGSRTWTWEYKKYSPMQLQRSAANQCKSQTSLVNMIAGAYQYHTLRG